MEKTDEEIAAQVQDGDTKSFGVLIERYEDRLKRYGRKFLSNREDIKELVQDVFLKAYTNIKGFDPKRKFSPWIYRIAHNEFVNQIRRSKFQPLNLIDSDTFFPHPVAKETADKEALENETKLLIEGSLGNLNPKYKEPLILFYFEEMSYRDISDILHIPVSTVGVRIRRGKRIIKKSLNNHKGIL